MRRSLSLIVLLVTVANARAQIVFDSTFIEEHACREAAAYQQRIEQQATVSFAPSHNYDLHFLRMDLHVTPNDGFVIGNLCYHFKALHAFDTFYLDCSDTLHVTEVRHHGVAASFSHHHDVLAIALAETSGANDSINIWYDGFPKGTGLSSVQRGSHNGDSLFATLSEPYGSRDWFPSKVSLDDKIDSMNMNLQVPLPNRAGTNGLLKKIDTIGTDAVYYWRSRYPIATYLIGIAVYPYLEIDHDVALNNDTLRLQHFLYPDHAQELINYTPELDSVLQLYTDHFSTYPFINEKYGHCQWNAGGGMEHQTMSFVGDFQHELVAHELAHQWFGDKITCGSWSDIWLNEGFAVYCTGLTYQYLFGGKWWMPYKITTRTHALRDSVSSVFCSDTSNVHRIFDSYLTYAKGACLLHQLRYLLGDDKFFGGVRDYITDTALTYRFARTKQLQMHLEQRYGASLDKYFNDWFYGNGYPNLDLQWSQRNAHVKINLEQSSFAHAADGFVFDMRIPVRFYGHGVDTTIDLENHHAVDAFEFDLPFAVDSVSIDPDLWWLIGRKHVQRGDYLLESGAAHAFPNPFANAISIATSNGASLVSMEIFSMDGKRVYQPDFTGNKISTQVDLSFLANGVYAARVHTDSGTQNMLLIKMP